MTETADRRPSPQSLEARAVAAHWTRRHTLVAVLGAVATGLLIGLPTDVVPNPVFGRAVPVTWWSYPALAAIAVLSGLLLATYVRPGGDLQVDAQDRPARRGALSGLVSLFAVGCPVCNKLVLVALGSSGAMTWFAPAQPLLAAASVAGLGWALRARWRGRSACPVTASAEAPAS
jgi:hypothetical protein